MAAGSREPRAIYLETRRHTLLYENTIVRIIKIHGWKSPRGRPKRDGLIPSSTTSILLASTPCSNPRKALKSSKSSHLLPDRQCPSWNIMSESYLCVFYCIKLWESSRISDDLNFTCPLGLVLILWLLSVRFPAQQYQRSDAESRCRPRSP